MSKLPWDEKIPVLSIDPAQATLADIAQLASELMEAKKEIAGIKEIRQKQAECIVKQEQETERLNEEVKGERNIMLTHKHCAESLREQLVYKDSENERLKKENADLISQLMTAADNHLSNMSEIERLKDMLADYIHFNNDPHHKRKYTLEELEEHALKETEK